ncbi:sigma-70 family RNA polymerase sigma factor [Streptacidiphilus jeojiensis]|uniref:sigma-70 family RNA polymerase sigma factor n=1 Tax=Streptacidiphilus jeojiensis TaxID=3229225 RepID=UPI0036D27184
MALMADSQEFVRLTAPFRRELLVHCYRILGSAQDAEDLVQETYLRAWRFYDGFEGRSSLRVWLYRIATSACLTALEHRSRRLLPSGLGAAEPTADRPLTHLPGTAWVQPLPDALAGLAGGAPDGDPAAIVAARSSVRLALAAALQHLPARQRVVLILRDVLAWRAGEVADLLDTTVPAVNSALHRARVQLRDVAPTLEASSEPDRADHRALLDRYTAAFENADVDTLVKLLHADVTLEMPPGATWFAGRDLVGRFLADRVLSGPGVFRMLPVRANGQPSVAGYLRGPDGDHHAHAIQVLTVREGRIASIVSFNQPELFAWFGLPARLAPVRCGSAAGSAGGSAEEQ